MVQPLIDILVVEDNAVNQALIKAVFSKDKFNVTSAFDGNEAVEECRKASFDMILMDLRMPKMNGFEATASIRSHCPNNTETPILAVTAEPAKIVKEKCYELGMDGFFEKPINPSPLRMAVMSLLKNG